MPIARLLAARGHDVSFVCPIDFEPLFTDEPFRTIGSRSLPSPSILDRHAAFVARWGTRLGGLFLPRLYFDRIVLPHLDELYEEAEAACSDADVVVSHPWSHLIVGPAAERLGIPTVVGDVFPMLVPSAHLAPPGQRNLGRRGNQAAWRLLHSPAINRAWFMGAFRQLRQRLGLPIQGWSLFGGRLSPNLNLGMFSPHYQPPLPDWPANYHVIGFCPWASGDDAMPPELEDILDHGEPPALVTLGSNAASALPDVFVAAAKALNSRGVRGVLLTSTRDVTEYVRTRVDPSNAVLPFVPLDIVLRRCRAVIHAGGLGTLASTLQAGLPSAIHPAVTDQIWHAQRCEALGVGVRTRRNIEKAVHRLLDDPALALQAARLGGLIRTDDGPRSAAELIEGTLSR